jgi:hypothetical protein
MGDFVTGLIIGGGNAEGDWRRYVNKLTAQVDDLQGKLRQEAYDRSLARANGKAVETAILSLPPEIRAMVADAMRAHYKQAYIKRATELNSGPGTTGYASRPDFAPTIAKIAEDTLHLNLTDIGSSPSGGVGNRPR